MGGGGKVNKASALIGWEGVGLTKVSADPLKKLMVKAEVWIQPEKWANERKKTLFKQRKGKKVKTWYFINNFLFKGKKNKSFKHFWGKIGNIRFEKFIIGGFGIIKHFWEGKGVEFLWFEKCVHVGWQSARGERGLKMLSPWCQRGGGSQNWQF